MGEAVPSPAADGSSNSQNETALYLEPNTAPPPLPLGRPSWVLLGALVDSESCLHSEPQAPGDSGQRTTNMNQVFSKTIY